MGRKKKAAKPQEKKRGKFTPNKADVEAVANGDLNRDAKRRDAIVDKAVKVERTFLAAKAKRDAAMEKLHVSLGIENGAIVRNNKQTMQVVFQMHSAKRGNANAERARGLINEYVDEMVGRSSLTGDERVMLAFLKGVVTESRGKIIMTKPMIDFKNMQLSDARLVEAQKLLGNAFDVSDPKLAVYVQEWDPKREKWLGIVAE